jgi:hypothetical protein
VRRCWPLVSLVAVLLLGLVVSGGLATAAAQEATPQGSPAAGPTVLPPDAPAYGATYAEWAARYFQWNLSFPMAVSPSTDPTGERCGYGQAGPVFFLPGGEPAFFEPGGTPPAGAPARACTVPASVPLLLHLFGANCSTVEPPPFFGRDEAELRTCTTALLDTTTVLTASVDGVAIPDLERYRVQTPLFRVALPADNYLGVEPTTVEAVGEGYFLVLAPLPPGEHEVRVGGVLPDVGVSLETAFNLTVAEPTVVAPPDGTPAP